MKTAAKLAFVALAPLGFLACTGAPGPGSPGTVPRTALDLLRLREPGTAWDAKSLLQADLDLDGTADYALAGSRKDRFVVGIVRGPVGTGSRHWTLEFPWKPGSQDSLCSRKARMRLEDLAEEDRPPGVKAAKGINLYDDRCDSFHIYWDPESRSFEHWRL